MASDEISYNLFFIQISYLAKNLGDRSLVTLLAEKQKPTKTKREIFAAISFFPLREMRSISGAVYAS